MPTHDDLVYAAGIIDGEGCILIAKRRTPANYELHVRVQTVDHIICPWLHHTFGGNLCWTDTAKNPNWSPRNIWAVSSAAAENFLRMIYPWLKLKKTEAELAFAFRATHKGVGKFLTDEERALQHKFYEDMKAAKVRHSRV